jgi:hypothetical protein
LLHFNTGVNHRPKLNFVIGQERKASWLFLAGSFSVIFSAFYPLSAIFEAAEIEKLFSDGSV